MITYIYWFTVLAMAFGIIYLIGFKNEEWKIASIAAAVVLLAGALAYYFHFQQVFVKRYGGVMTIHVPQGEIHIAATWKDDNLWIENYDPKTNTCYFREYSRGNLLQGKVVIKDCNPLMPHDTAPVIPAR
ncbi:MAG TPA: hypothetical protein ENJ11_04095 [Gammaproteobacteria bacterium]|nr:hypothetical protein [Gammaproteobacteria bacterium]